jgi:EcsC protein family
MSLSETDIEALRYAKSLLETPGLAAKFTNVFGVPIEKGLDLLPGRWTEIVATATRKSLETALRVALTTMSGRPHKPAWERLHKLAVGATGAAGGAFGLAGLPVELPVSTTIMMRSIADIARSEGELLHTPETKLACLEVFALGGRSPSDNAADSAYFVIRAGLARSISEAAKHLTEKGLAERGAPAILRLIAQLATRFGVNVSEKVAAQSVPVIGAAGGAVINLLFIDHFQDVARGHFIVRRLERAYSPEVIRDEYERL